MVFASPEVLLRDGSFFWEVIITDKKCAFSKRLCAVVINECHLVWGWREFRKDYLSLGASCAHFQHLPFVALSATIIPNVFKFIVNSVGLRPGLRLYKAAIDRQNITQMVAQIDPAQSYVQRSVLIPRTGAAWQIPKSMFFVDTIAECISI
jgi:superfamily II DNA helicase RecQ